MDLQCSGPHDSTKLLRALEDGGAHARAPALIRTRQIVSPFGNFFTGGLGELVLNIYLDEMSTWRDAELTPHRPLVPRYERAGLLKCIFIPDGQPFWAAVRPLGQ